MDDATEVSCWDGQWVTLFDITGETNSEIGCLNENSENINYADYRGEASTTAEGNTCQRWTDQMPHQHENTPENKPEEGLGEHNFCRNPDKEPRPWCYTTNPDQRW